ncbi:hypothetical protein M885DRAFT_626640 [Pelagophyceae sp. CCMP2097]|nr:hypothetical protein M885DRAFT_626640 [Pelagophyceae sp. CCMP2097]
MGVSGVVSADEALFRLTAKVGASPGLLATLVKALIADVRRLDAKVDALEAGHGGQLRDMKLNLDILVSNIQGYDDPEEEVEREKAERAAMREDLERDKAERAAQVAQRRADLERDKADCAKEVEARRIEFEREQAARLAALAVVEREAAARAAALEQQRSTRALWREKSESATEMERNRKSQQDFDKRAQEDLDRRARDLDAAAQEAFDVSAQEELALLGPMARRIVRREAGGFLARNPGARPPHHAAVFPAARDADAVAPAAFLEALGALGFEVSAEERAELLAFYAVEPGGKVRGREFMLHFHQATWHQLSQKEQAAEVLGRLRDPVVAAVLRAAGIEALTADDADAAHHEADAGARKRWQAVAEWWPEARLLRPEAAPADTDEAAPADEAAPNAEAVARRKRVRKRWRWAFMMIKMRRLQRRIPLTKARTDRKHSLAVRLQAAEDGLDRAAFKLDQLASGASPDRFAEIERCARWCEAQLAGGGQGAAGGETARGAVRGNALGAVERLGRLEASMRAADESARKADEAASALAGDCAALRLDVRAARDSSDAACEAAAAAALRAGADAAARCGAVARLRRRAAVLSEAFRDACHAAGRSRDVIARRGGGKLVRDVAAPAAAFFDGGVLAGLWSEKRFEALAGSGPTRDAWNANALDASKYVAEALLADDTDERFKAHEDAGGGAADDGAPGKSSRCSLADVPCAAPAGGDDGVAGYADARAVGEAALEALAAALDADLGEACVSRARNAVDVWVQGPFGPVGAEAARQAASFDAAIVACQAVLAARAEAAGRADEVADRLCLLEACEAARKLADAGLEGAFDAAAIRRQRDDMAAFKTHLTETRRRAAYHVAAVQADVLTKAAQLPTAAALEGLRHDILRLGRGAAGRLQLQQQLALKLDKADVGRIAELIQSGALSEISKLTAAKMQIADFRCLCCDSPLHGRNISHVDGPHAPPQALPRAPAPAPQMKHALPDVPATQSDRHLLVSASVDSLRTRPAQGSLDDLADDSAQTFSRYPRLMPARATKRPQPPQLPQAQGRQ